MNLLNDTSVVQVGTTAGISDDAENLQLCKNDFDNALDEVKPMFGVSQEELAQVIQNGVIDYDPIVDVSKSHFILHHLC